MKKTVLVLGVIFSLSMGWTVAQEPPTPMPERNYKVFVPSGYEDGTPFPLVMALHGAGGDGAHMEEITGFSQLAETENFIVVYPDSLFNNWDFGGGIQTSDGITSVDDLSFLSSLVDTLAETYSIDTSRVLVTGFSNGASMAYWLACHVPEKFLAVAAVAAPIALYQIEDCSDALISVFLMHGTQDPILAWDRFYLPNGQIVSLSAPDTIAYWADHDGCDLENYEFVDLPDLDPEDGSTIKTLDFQGCEGGTGVTFYGVIGGGHTWAGHVIDAPFDLGATNMDVDVSQVIWDWFAALPREDSSPIATDTPEN